MESSGADAGRSSPPDDSAELDGLLCAAREGSAQARNSLFREYQALLLAVANDELDSGLRGKLGASDIVQETLIEAEQGIGDFRGRTIQEFRVWLTRILQNNLADARRRYFGTEKRCLDREAQLSSSSSYWGQLTGNGDTPSVILGNDEDAQALTMALATLTDDYRDVIYLKNWELLPFAEIGRRMDRSEDAARKLWARAIEALQLAMGKPDE